MFSPRGVPGLLCATLAIGCSEVAPEVSSDPGSVIVRRLNRGEYDRTLRDLTGTNLRPSRAFAPDDHAHGFDNNASVQTLSPLAFEQYEAAARDVAVDMLRPSTAVVLQPELESLSAGAVYRERFVRLFDEGALRLVVPTPKAGAHVLHIRWAGEALDGTVPQVELQVDGKVLGGWAVTAAVSAPELLSVPVDVSNDETTIELRMINDEYSGGSFRSAYVDWLRLEAIEAYAPAPQVARYLSCQPKPDLSGGCLRTYLQGLLPRAWRGPVDPNRVLELERLGMLALEEGQTGRAALVEPTIAALLSPRFLFRTELDAEPDDDSWHPLSAHELAVRMSYFLWSSMPDDELLAVADSGALLELETRRLQAERMLTDPRAQALTKNFAGQWLYIRALAEAMPDPVVFPNYDYALTLDLGAQLEAYFENALASDRSLGELLTHDEIFLNDRLAEHYGLPAVGSDDLVLTQVSDPARAGLLGHGALLMATSYPARTSPVQRGKWVLSQLLCSEPPPPPPGVEGIDTEGPAEGSLRQRLEQHREAPECRGCHAAMDPIGFALENFDGVGQWRTEDQGYAIDASGALPGGKLFDGPRQLAAILASQPSLTACVSQHAFVYAMGRGRLPTDAEYIKQIVAQADSEGASLKSILLAIIESNAFGARRALLEVER